MVQGQDEALRFLSRIVDGKLTIPLLLVGREGVGKRLAVTQTAKAIFCVGTKAPGCMCFQCKQLDDLVHPDFVYVTAPEGKELGVEPIRGIVEKANSFPSMAPLLFFVVDGVDRLTAPAANALLKTLEEPPPTVRFCLLAENRAGILPTIRSRCGLVQFYPLPDSILESKLAPFEADVAKRLVLCRMAEGSVGQAIRFWGGGRLSLRDRVWMLLTTGLAGDLSSLFSTIDDLEKELDLGIIFLLQMIHDLLLYAHAPERMIHCDLAAEIGRVHQQLGADRLVRLRDEVRAVEARNAASYINLPFHLKAALATTFGV